MSLWRIAWSYLWNRKLTTGLTIVSVALAVALISTLLTIRDETRRRFEEEQQAYDVVVGPGGSRLQLVLNAVYFLDQPVGYLPYGVLDDVKKHEDVDHAFPVALGDTYKGFRIVGTVRDMFDYPWESPVTGEKRYPFKIAEGRFFDGPMEAVVGYRVAQVRGLTVGDTFTGTHGTIEVPDELAEYDHSKHAYEVVGVLQPSGTSNDRAIFVDLQSVWDLHPDFEHVEGEDEHHEEERRISAVLVGLYSSAMRFTFSDEIEQNYDVVAAIPVNQILSLYNKILEPAVVILRTVGYIVVIISALSILIGLYLSIIQRKRDLAIMRALGASAGEIFGAVLIEAFLVTLMGIAAGWVLGKAASFGVGTYMTQVYGFTITGLSTSGEELSFFAIVGFVGLLAGILPAWQAYQTDVARDLSAS